MKRRRGGNLLKLKSQLVFYPPNYQIYIRQDKPVPFGVHKTTCD